jgi:NAD(P) transhydrogenase subunit alpha
MKITILKESVDGEKRVAATPDTVKKICAMGFDVAIESGAGEGAFYNNDAYINAGAKVEETPQLALENAHILLTIHRPSPEILPKGCLVIGNLDPYGMDKEWKEYSEKQISLLSMEFIPRITRAQTMDVLSSQANLAGYRAVIEGAYHFARAFPMMMTAAGTIPPARVLVFGAGVAGLQAIATAKRLGAVVSAFDVRSSAKEQVQSLGGTFIDVPAEESGDGSGGYAKEMSQDYQQRQRAKITEVLQQTDIAITTALVPGKAAPLLITKEMVSLMKAGSVIVDLAVLSGGNCELSQKGETVNAGGITILDGSSILSRIARDASNLYGKNILNLLNLIKCEKQGTYHLSKDDEIITSSLIMENGSVVHPQFQEK